MIAFSQGLGVRASLTPVVADDPQAGESPAASGFSGAMDMNETVPLTSAYSPVVPPSPKVGSKKIEMMSPLDDASPGIMGSAMISHRV